MAACGGAPHCAIAVAAVGRDARGAPGADGAGDADGAGASAVVSVAMGTRVVVVTTDAASGGTLTSRCCSSPSLAVGAALAGVRGAEVTGATSERWASRVK